MNQLVSQYVSKNLPTIPISLPIFYEATCQHRSSHRLPRQDAVAAVFRRWKLILGTYLGILATVALGLFVIPTYRAAGTSCSPPTGRRSLPAAIGAPSWCARTSRRDG